MKHTPISSQPAEAKRTFAELGLAEKLLESVARLNFHTPSDIQSALIPIALAGKDCLGQAKTGTGKTAAFSLPMLQRVEPGKGIQALVLVPTRELAKQVDEHVRALGHHNPHKTALVYGGQRMGSQIEQLKKAEIVVGTPGRVLDMMRRQILSLSGVRLVVLDEVDRMLDIGFRDDIRKILRELPQEHQTIFVSATIDDDIRKLAKSFMRDPVEVNVSRDVLTVESIEQGFITVDPHDKYLTLLGFIKHEAPTLMIVFTNTKHSARRVAKRLIDAGIRCKELHGDLLQNRRERVMESFRKSHIQVLVATDLASRGIDVMEVSHIINYDLPEDVSVYVHRVGRTARMGKSGTAIAFVTPEEGRLLTAIEMHINKELPQIQADWIVRRQHDESAGSARPANGKPESAEVAAAPAGEEVAAAVAGTRSQESLRRDETFESLGLRPIRRTLGSRFRSARRFRR